METAAIVRDLKGLMEREISILDTFSQEEDKLKKSIIENDWSAVETTLKDVVPLVGRLEEAEERRNERFISLREAVNEDAEAGFYHVIVHLREDDREALASLYRKLKITVLRIQALGWTIDNHVRTLSLTIYQILEELFPFRRGKIYSSKGDARPVEANPMILNHSL